jgi:hypothetical protein
MPLEIRQLVVRSSVVQGRGAGERDSPRPEDRDEREDREEALQLHLAGELRRALRAARDDRKER